MKYESEVHIEPTAAVQYSAMRYGTAKCLTVQDRTVPCGTVPHSVDYSTVQSRMDVKACHALTVTCLAGKIPTSVVGQLKKNKKRDKVKEGEKKLKLC